MTKSITIYIYRTTVRAKAKRLLKPFFDSIDSICRDFDSDVVNTKNKVK